MTSILVTGGSGFIGRHFCEAATQLGISALRLDPQSKGGGAKTARFCRAYQPPQ